MFDFPMRPHWHFIPIERLVRSSIRDPSESGAVLRWHFGEGPGRRFNFDVLLGRRF